MKHWLCARDVMASDGNLHIVVTTLCRGQDVSIERCTNSVAQIKDIASFHRNFQYLQNTPIPIMLGFCRLSSHTDRKLWSRLPDHAAVYNICASSVYGSSVEKIFSMFFSSFVRTYQPIIHRNDLNWRRAMDAEDSTFVIFITAGSHVSPVNLSPNPNLNRWRHRYTTSVDLAT